MGERHHDREIWEGIFRDSPASWSSAPPSALMFECFEFLRDSAVTRVVDLGSGFGRWTNFLSDRLDCEVVGVDYAIDGNRLGVRFGTDGARSRFCTGEIIRLPFLESTFDGFVAVLILDNVAESDGRLAVNELDRVVRSGSPGFVVLNPWPMPEGLDTSDNPTRDCTRRDYNDEEALELLRSHWHVLGWARVEHELRAFRIRT